jgi:hypothetical protein
VTFIAAVLDVLANYSELALLMWDWPKEGELEGQTFELPQTTLIPDPTEAGFIPLAALTPEVVTAWIETHEDRMFSIKAHIQYVLNKQVAEAGLVVTQMPWAPAPEVVPITPVLEPVV